MQGEQNLPDLPEAARDVPDPDDVDESDAQDAPAASAGLTSNLSQADIKTPIMLMYLGDDPTMQKKVGYVHETTFKLVSSIRFFEFNITVASAYAQSLSTVMVLADKIWRTRVATEIQGKEVRIIHADLYDAKIGFNFNVKWCPNRASILLEWVVLGRVLNEMIGEERSVGVELEAQRFDTEKYKDHLFSGMHASIEEILSHTRRSSRWNVSATHSRPLPRLPMRPCWPTSPGDVGGDGEARARAKARPAEDPATAQPEATRRYDERVEGRRSSMPPLWREPLEPPVPPPREGRERRTQSRRARSRSQQSRSGGWRRAIRGRGRSSSSRPRCTGWAGRRRRRIERLPTQCVSSSRCRVAHLCAARCDAFGRSPHSLTEPGRKQASLPVRY